LASDISNIVKDEIVSTLSSLLAKPASVKETQKAEEDLGEGSFLLVATTFEYERVSSKVSFYIPTSTATKFEYFMLGGMGDLKEAIDDEIVDAVGEIVSNICGSITTSSNAQGFVDLGSLKVDITSKEIIDSNSINSSENLYKFLIDLDGDELFIVINFGSELTSYIAVLSGDINESEVVNETEEEPSKELSTQSAKDEAYDSILDEISSNNLKLLMNIKLKLSVRLGTKVFLLKDILKWDIGEIIELEQMVNEPLDILVNGVKIGEGEAVVVDGKFGVKIRNIGNGDEILKGLELKNG
jgi:flagellar motor switch protein FliN/FliY